MTKRKAVRAAFSFYIQVFSPKCRWRDESAISANRVRRGVSSTLFFNFPPSLDVRRRTRGSASLLWEARRTQCVATRTALPRLHETGVALGLIMPETPFPSQEELQKKIQEFMKANFGEHVAVSAFTQQASTDEPPEERPESIDPFQFNATPKQIKAYLDRFVIQQEEAKKTLSIAVCDHYNHVNRVYRLEKEDPEAARKIEYSKGNVLLLGPTGVGKTYLVKHIADLIGVPFVKADATKFSETGYVGGDVEDLVRGLVQKANGNVELAEHGIIYLDEIDKLATASDRLGRD